MNNPSKANLLLVLTVVALIWHAILVFAPMPVVTFSADNGQTKASVDAHFNKVVVKENGKILQTLKLPAKDRYRIYFGTTVCAVLYIWMFAILLRYQQHWGQGNSVGVTSVGTQVGTMQNTFLLVGIGGIVGTVWSYLTIKGLLQGTADFSIGYGVYVDGAHSIFLGAISLFRFNPFEEVPPPRIPIPPPPPQYLAQPAPPPQYLAPPPPPGAVACPACRTVQAQDSRFCKSCGRPLAQPCPQCQALVGPDARFCPKCGRSTAPTCPKCNKPFDPSGRFCEHCGAPTAAQDASPAAPSTQAKRKEVFVGAMQFVQDPNEEGFAFCSECGKKEEKRNLYHNDEINQYVHRDCLMSLQNDAENPNV